MSKKIKMAVEEINPLRYIPIFDENKFFLYKPVEISKISKEKANWIRNTLKECKKVQEFLRDLYFKAEQAVDLRLCSSENNKPPPRKYLLEGQDFLNIPSHARQFPKDEDTKDEDKTGVL